MARIRTIKPEFPQSESMGRVSRESRLCFILMFTLADDSGRLRGNSRMLASLLYPYDDDAKKHIDVWLKELSREGCIVQYESGGDQYIELSQWHKHQKIDKPSVSKIPPPSEDSRGFARTLELSSEEGIKEGIKDSRGKEKKEIVAPEGVTPQTWNDWLSLRKAKKAVVTTTVINGAIAEAEKAGLSIEEFLKVWCTRGSQGLEASWLKPHELKNSRPDEANKFAGAI